MLDGKLCDYCGNPKNWYFEEEDCPEKVLFKVYMISMGPDRTYEEGVVCNECVASWMCETPKDFKIIHLELITEEVD